MISLFCALVAVAIGLAAVGYRREMIARERVIDELYDRLRSERREDGAVIARERDLAEGRAREIVRLREQLAAERGVSEAEIARLTAQLRRS